MPTRAKKIIMLYGYPLSGKSTAASKIEEYLAKSGTAAEIISSAKIRLRGKHHSGSKRFVDEEDKRTKLVKDKAYKELCSLAQRCLRRGVIPILDATFHKYCRRKWVYTLAKKEKAEVYVVWTVFSNEKAIRKLLMKRRLANKRVMLHNWQQYATMASQTEKLDSFELSKNFIIRFDRQKNTALILKGSADSFAKLLREAIKS